ncbi:probable carboxylesterase 2 [Triticum dicoccoides]|uniref:probable carboxylesterase 2 n=1 Tax=Triticum dicoccoides TaxID=85692 RepID=UPI000E7B6A88|nr:probable carboxylesterase 2 [Triticum dicoccoides]
MASIIRSGVAICNGWAATRPCRRLALDRTRRLPQLQRPSLSTTFLSQITCPGAWRSRVRSTSDRSGAPTDAAAADEVLLEAPGSFRIYRSGKIDRLNDPTILPAGVDEATGVASKDVVLDADTGLSVRLYLPNKLQDASAKLPVVVYFHGGAFLIGSARDPTYHKYLNALAAAAGVLTVSVDYRLAPEHPLPAAYDDSWAALRWAASAQDGWIADHGDTSKLFVAGDSAGANIAHEMLVRAASNDGSPRVEGAILLHPWFSGNAAVEGEPPAAAKVTGLLWSYACRGSAVGGADDPRMNPLASPALERLGCARMLVTTGLEDGLASRNRAYYDAVAASGWRGKAAWLELEGEGHVFFLGKLECDNAKRLMDRVVAFIADA